MAINLLIVSTVHIAQQNDNKADVDQTNNGADSWLLAYSQLNMLLKTIMLFKLMSAECKLFFIITILYGQMYWDTCHYTNRDFIDIAFYIHKE